MRLNLIQAGISAYLASVASLNGLPDTSKKFNVLPAVQDKLEQAIQESSDFLKAINITGVIAQEGRSIGVGARRPIASRTDTGAGDRRTPKRVTAMAADTFRCEQTNFDTAMSYEELDAWAHKPEFPVLLAQAIRDGQALDRIMVGWNGTHVAVSSDATANPLLQDVNKGWLQKLREYNVTSGKASQVMTQGATAGKIVIKADGTGDYNNLDALVFDLVRGLHPVHQKRKDLVAITSGNLLHDKYLPIINGADKNTEKLAAEVLMGARNIGGLPAIDVPHFPDGKVLVTPLKNLSIYYQISARRRLARDNPELDQFENFESSNDAYVIEDLLAAMLAENIEIAP